MRMAGRAESVEAFAAASTATTLALLGSHSHCWRVHFHLRAYFLQLRCEIGNGRFQFLHLLCSFRNSLSTIAFTWSYRTL